MTAHRRLGATPEPALEPRLARHGTRVQSAERLEELLGMLGEESERRGKLDQQRTESCPQPSRLLQEHLEQDVRGYQGLIVRDRARQLDREAELLRHGGGPALVDRTAVLPVERRVDLRGGKPGGV